MKKIFNLIALAFTALVISPSCSQLLEPEPYGLVDLDLVWTKYNYTSSLVSSIGNSADWAGGFPYAAYCDEAEAVQDRTASGWYSWYNQDFNVSTYIMSGGWDGIYNNIRHINFFLNNEYKISFTNVKPEEREFWDAKAHMYRAWHYFTLMKRYGKAIIFTDTYDINETFSGVKLNNVEQIADFIIQEVDLALATKEDESSPYTFRWRVNSYNVLNRGFAWVLKARTALFAASPLFYEEGSKYTWEYAYEINKEAVEQLLAHDHKLFDVAPPDKYAYNTYDYYHIYPSGDVARSIDKETIHANNGNMNIWQNYGLPTTKGRLSCGICPTQELVDCYETIDGEPILDLEKPYLDEYHLQPNYNKNNKLYDPQNPYENRDPRFYGTIYYNNAPRWWANYDSLRVQTYVGGNCGISEDPTSVYYTRTGYYLRKYNCSISDEDGNYDGRVHTARLAEMFLNLAECACEAGHLEIATDYTNLVRERVGMPDLPHTLTQDQLRLRIRNERRVELAFETNRWDDIRRWKIIDQVAEHVTGMRITKDASGKLNYERFSFGTRVNKGDDKYLLYPVPDEEVQKMKQNTSPTGDPKDGDNWQNPGWDD